MARQVALIAAEREVITLRTQLSHQQQHIQLIEARLLEQGQDVAAMLGRRDDQQSTSPMGSRAPSIRPALGLGTEALAPQEAWELDLGAVEAVAAAGGTPVVNLAAQLRPQADTPTRSRQQGAGDTAAAVATALAAQAQEVAFLRYTAVRATEEAAEKDAVIRDLQEQLTAVSATPADAGRRSSSNSALSAAGALPSDDLQQKLDVATRLLAMTQVRTHTVTWAPLATPALTLKLLPFLPACLPACYAACHVHMQYTTPVGSLACLLLPALLPFGLACRLSDCCATPPLLGPHPSAPCAAEGPARQRHCRAVRAAGQARVLRLFLSK